jgi:hypothetical protein
MFVRAGAVMVTAVAAGLPSAVVEARPTLWRVLGYEFEAAGMIAAVLACVAVRVHLGSRERQYRWVLDAPVSALALMFTIAIVAEQRPEPLPALMTGTGIGAIGAGLIRLAERWGERLLGGGSAPPVTRGDGR